MDNSSAVAYVGVGSNIHPEKNVPEALALLENNPQVALIGISTFYRTAPISDPAASILPWDQGPQEVDPDFLNGVLEIRTGLSPDGILLLFSQIEAALGRTRPGGHFAPRTIDLDLLLYGRGYSGISGPTWEPIGPKGYFAHMDIERRAFVAHPLLELAPNLALPPHGIPLRAFAAVFESPGGLAETELTHQLRARFLTP